MKKRIWVLILMILVSFVGFVACSVAKEPQKNEEETEVTHVNSELATENILESTEKIELDNHDMATESISKEENIEQEKPKKQYTYTQISKQMYAIENVNVRNLPESIGEKIGTLSKGQVIQVNAKCNETEWYQIDYNGIVAFVSNKYLSEKVLEESKPDDVSGLSWVSELECAKKNIQMVIVACEGSYATVSMHTKKEEIWAEEFSVKGRIGRNGAGKLKEGDKKTPIGIYKFNMAFGVLGNPGITAMPYIQLNESHHWVDDSNSQYYNQFVSTNEVVIDWKSSEHLYKVVPQYNYALSINYNEECVPNKGSAIFLHCTSRNFGTTAGCVAIPEEYMIKVMKNLKQDCIIVIDEVQNIMKY